MSTQSESNKADHSTVPMETEPVLSSTEELKTKLSASTSRVQNSKSIEFLLNEAVGPFKKDDIATSFSVDTLKKLLSLFDKYHPLTEDGYILRKLCIDNGIVSNLFSDLSSLTHYAEPAKLKNHELKSINDTASPSCSVKESVNLGVENKVKATGLQDLTCSSSSTPPDQNFMNDSGINQVKLKHALLPQKFDFYNKLFIDSSQTALQPKGVGYATGFQEKCNVQAALAKKKKEEQNTILIIKVLISYIDPKERGNLYLLPDKFPKMLTESNVISIIVSYLKNDSILDISRHILLYETLIQLLKVISVSKQLVQIFLSANESTENLIISSLSELMLYIDTYLKNLNHPKVREVDVNQVHTATTDQNLVDSEDLLTLYPKIKETKELIENEIVWLLDFKSEDMSPTKSKSTISERYIECMKMLDQFGTYDIMSERTRNIFNIMYHYDSLAQNDNQNLHPIKLKRLAQESVTLSTSLPLTYSSSVFVRCDTNRLDMMKVLITGPADTPYANGCFIFDVYFPAQYPNVPMKVFLETTGRGAVRFNPNLYQNGKVCLSILNTWSGSPEEQWNSQTSNLLQVLVSIQSLIFVPDPFFNEPGFQMSMGTPSGKKMSHAYNMKLLPSTIEWAMLDQMRNPCPCFKDIIQAHFYTKGNEILAQIENWITIAESSGYAGGLKALSKSVDAEIKKLPVPKYFSEVDV